jgi:mannose-6-phosphate isomerase-like protein (cupin superfamily)
MDLRFLPPDAPELVTILGVRHRILATAEETGGAYTLLKLSVPTGAGIPAHVHTREDELFHVVEGSAEFLVGSEKVDARAGASVIGPRGRPHGFKATSKEPCRMVVVVTPGGFERFLGELKGAKDKAAIAAIAGRHGISFVS